MEEPQPLTYLEQAKLLEKRGMKIDSSNYDYAIKTLQQLGYYRIKEVARPLSKVVNKKVNYDGVSFRDVITRYYQDKNLRVYLLHGIEEIEVSIKTSIAYILGKNGPFYYLHFPSWCNREEFCKYYLADRQKDFRKRLRYKLHNSNNPELNNPKNLDKGTKLPSIWLVVDVLTFGDAVHLITLMSKNNQKKLASFYKCTPTQLISWLKCLKFVRNICAHNSNIIDIKLETTPSVLASWDSILYKYEKNDNYTDRIAVVLCVLKELMKNVNPSYNYGKIYSPIRAISKNDEISQQIGFRNKNSIHKLFPKDNNKNKKRQKQYKHKNNKH